MQKKTQNRWLAKVTCPILFGILLLCASVPAQAFTAGETYDSSNWEEIQQFGPPKLIEWVKKGDFLLTTKKLEFEWGPNQPQYLEACKENDGKFDLNEEGYLIEKATGKPPAEGYGTPFPTIDPNDPKAGAKIMENGLFLRYRLMAFSATIKVMWIGRGGKEREVIAGGDYLFYQGRGPGPMIENPKGLLEQQNVYVVEPFELRGTTSMLWVYNDDRQDSYFAYVPMLRRVRRASPAARSDPFLGSDMCTDDAYCWAGKNQSMTWKLLGEATIFAPLTSEKKVVAQEHENGIIDRVYPPIKFGYEVPGWQGAPWAPVNLAWHPRDCWVVEAIPKAPYYNYGRMVYYVDKAAFNIWFKEIYDHSGEYWKTVFVTMCYGITQHGYDWIGNADDYVGIDEKTQHATLADVYKQPGREYRIRLPESIIGPDKFTQSYLMQLSK